MGYTMNISFGLNALAPFASVNIPRGKLIRIENNNISVDGLEITPFHKDWIKYIEIKIDYTPEYIWFVRKLYQRLKSMLQMG